MNASKWSDRAIHVPPATFSPALLEEEVFRSLSPPGRRKQRVGEHAEVS